MSDSEEPQPEAESEEDEAQDAVSDEEQEWDETAHHPHQGEDGQDIV